MESERQYLTPTFKDNEGNYIKCKTCNGDGKACRGEMPSKPGDKFTDKQLDEIVECWYCDGEGWIEIP